MKSVFTFLKRYRWYLKGACAIILLTILVSTIEVSVVLPYLIQVNYILAFIFSLYVVSLCLGTLRWRLFLPKVSFQTLFVTAWIGNFFSNFLPSSIGGDSYRVLALREQVGFRVVTSAVFLDRMAGVVPIVVVGMPTLLLLLPQYMSGLYVMIIILVTGSIGWLFYTRARRTTWFQSVMFRVTGALMGTSRLFIYASLISIGYLALGALSLWLYYHMFGYQLPFTTVFGLYAVLQLVELLPISINSLGVREGTLVFLFSLVGVPAEVSLGIAILSRLVLLTQTAIGGVLYAFRP